MDVSSWNVGHVLKTAWKWEQLKSHLRADGTNVSFISHTHVRFLSCVISFIVLKTLPSPSSDVLLSSLIPVPTVHSRDHLWQNLFQDKPFCFEKKNSSLKGNDRYEGFAVDLLRLLSNRLHFNYTLKILDGPYGSFKNGEWTGLVGELNKKARYWFAGFKEANFLGEPFPQWTDSLYIIYWYISRTLDSRIITLCCAIITLCCAIITLCCAIITLVLCYYNSVLCYYNTCAVLL